MRKKFKKPLLLSLIKLFRKIKFWFIFISNFFEKLLKKALPSLESINGNEIEIILTSKQLRSLTGWLQVRFQVWVRRCRRNRLAIAEERLWNRPENSSQLIIKERYM